MTGVVDTLLIGGGMVATFLLAHGWEVGDSLVERDRVDTARRLEAAANERGVRFVLPIDLTVADQFDSDANFQVVPANGVTNGWRIMDIGPHTIALFNQEIARCKTVAWNGPMGVFEFPNFANGTRAVADTLANLKATTIVGGGSTAEAVHTLGLADRMAHVSTGGGASLEFLEGRVLPGVAALLDK